MSIYFQGALLGLSTFLIIGVFHPIVIKTEYHFGTRPWMAFLAVGIGCGIASLFIAHVFWSAVIAIIGFSCLWSIIEIFEQRQRVIKGWFPMNPKRKHLYPAPTAPYARKRRRGKEKYHMQKNMRRQNNDTFRTDDDPHRRNAKPSNRNTATNDKNGAGSSQPSAGRTPREERSAKHAEARNNA